MLDFASEVGVSKLVDIIFTYEEIVLSHNMKNEINNPTTTSTPIDNEWDLEEMCKRMEAISES